MLAFLVVTDENPYDGRKAMPKLIEPKRIYNDIKIKSAFCMMTIMIIIRISNICKRIKIESAKDKKKYFIVSSRNKNIKK